MHACAQKKMTAAAAAAATVAAARRTTTSSTTRMMMMTTRRRVVTAGVGVTAARTTAASASFSSLSSSSYASSWGSNGSNLSSSSLMLARRTQQQQSRASPPVGVRLFSSSSSGSDPSTKIASLLDELRKLDTACLCDANNQKMKLKKDDGTQEEEQQQRKKEEKKDSTAKRLIDSSKSITSAVLSSTSSKKTKSAYYSATDGIKLMDPSIKLLNPGSLSGSGGSTSTNSAAAAAVMVGIARTVQCTQRNDILAVLRGLMESSANEVLVVNTLQSYKAVAGEIFATEGARRNLNGIIVVDGPMRDLQALQQSSSDNNNKSLPPCYATSVTSVAGTTKSVGRQQVTIGCDGGRGVVEVSPGDVVVGDMDGILVGSVEAFESLLPLAKQIRSTERHIITAINQDNRELGSFTNYKEHLENLLENKDDSNLEFRI